MSSMYVYAYSFSCSLASLNKLLHILFINMLIIYWLYSYPVYFLLCIELFSGWRRLGILLLIYWNTNILFYKILELIYHLYLFPWLLWTCDTVSILRCLIYNPWFNSSCELMILLIYWNFLFLYATVTSKYRCFSFGMGSVHLYNINIDDCISLCRECWRVKVCGAQHHSMTLADHYRLLLYGNWSSYAVALGKERKSMLRVGLWQMNLFVNCVKHHASKFMSLFL